MSEARSLPGALRPGVRPSVTCPPRPPERPAPSAPGVIMPRPRRDVRGATAARWAAQLQLPFPLSRARGVYGAPAAAVGPATAAVAAAGCYLYGEEEEEERELRDTSRSGGGPGRVWGCGKPRGRAMAPAEARLWRPRSWPPGTGGNGPGGLSGVRRAVMTPPLCTWDSVVGEEIESGGRWPTWETGSQLALAAVARQSGCSQCSRHLPPGRVPAKRVISDMNAAVLSSRRAGSPRRTCDLSNAKAWGATAGPLRPQSGEGRRKAGFSCSVSVVCACACGSREQGKKEGVPSSTLGF